MIYPKEPCEIEVLEETYMTYRVPCRNLGTPAKFKISYKSLVTAAGKRADLKVFSSPVHKEPYQSNECKPYYNVKLIENNFFSLNSFWFTPRISTCSTTSTSTSLLSQSTVAQSLCLSFSMMLGCFMERDTAARKAC